MAGPLACGTALQAVRLLPRTWASNAASGSAQEAAALRTLLWVHAHDRQPSDGSTSPADPRPALVVDIASRSGGTAGAAGLLSQAGSVLLRALPSHDVGPGGRHTGLLPLPRSSSSTESAVSVSAQPQPAADICLWNHSLYSYSVPLALRPLVEAQPLRHQGLLLAHLEELEEEAERAAPRPPPAAGA